MRQLYICDTFEPKYCHELWAKGKTEVLESHVFLKLNRDGKIKRQAVSGGNKQRASISKEEAISPIIVIETVLLSCVIEFYF